MERKVIVPAREVDDLQLQTDASGTIGFGAFFNVRWFRGDWSSQHLELNITCKELFAIVAACATCGIVWLRLRVEFQCDNQAAVECLKTGTSRSPAVMALIRTLYSICVMHNFLIRASHLPGISNTIADALSRNKMDAFRTCRHGHSSLTGLSRTTIKLAWVINRSCSTQADPPTRMGHKPLLLSAGRPTWSYTAPALGRPATRFVNAHSIEASSLPDIPILPNSLSCLLVCRVLHACVSTIYSSKGSRMLNGRLT